MRFSKLPLMTVVLLALVGSARGQITEFDDPDLFSEEAIILGFREFALGAGVLEAGQLYSSVGVTFQGELSSRPVIDVFTISPSIPPNIDLVLLNQSQTESSADRALIIRFRDPVWRVGFTIGNGTQSTVATIQARTVTGELLGEIQHPVKEGPGSFIGIIGPFVGFETTDPSGISMVTIDYGEDDRSEAIGYLGFEFIRSPVFRTYIPQVGDGRVGDLTVRTLIKIEELLNRTTDVRLRLLDGEGVPLALTLDGETNGTFEFSLPPKGIKQFQSSGGDALSAGYACIESNLPVAAYAIYQTFGPDGELLAEAGIQGEEEKTALRGVLDRNTGNSLDVALAFANTSSSENEIKFLVRDEGGLVPDFDTHSLTLTVAPGHHEAFYISDRFPILRDQNFMGSFEIVGTESLVLTTLRAINGIARSSLPIASTQADSKISFPEAAEE
ncbi:MAG: hypothetical protein ACRD1R_08375 [Acidobacteriota bacterium]